MLRFREGPAGTVVSADAKAVGGGQFRDWRRQRVQWPALALPGAGAGSCTTSDPWSLATCGDPIDKMCLCGCRRCFDADVLEHVPLENRIRLVTCGSSWSGGARIFVDQAAQDGFSADPFAVEVGYGEVVIVSAVGDALGDALVRPGCVVVRLILG